jgi:hypothetical protein
LSGVSWRPLALVLLFALPAATSAFQGLRAEADLARLAERSATAAIALARLRRLLDAASPTYDHVAVAATRAASIMGAELSDWRFVLERRRARQTPAGAGTIAAAAPVIRNALLLNDRLEQVFGCCAIVDLVAPRGGPRALRADHSVFPMSSSTCRSARRTPSPGIICKARAAIEAPPAQPVDRPAAPDPRGRFAVSRQGVIGDLPPVSHRTGRHARIGVYALRKSPAVRQGWGGSLRRGRAFAGCRR